MPWFSALAVVAVVAVAALPPILKDAAVPEKFVPVSAGEAFQAGAPPDAVSTPVPVASIAVTPTADW